MAVFLVRAGIFHQFMSLFGVIWVVMIGGFIWIARLSSEGDAPLLRNLVTYWKPSSSGQIASE